MTGRRNQDKGRGDGQKPNPVIELLIREALLSPEQAEYARRVAMKLPVGKPLCDVVRELGYVTEDQLRQAIRRNRGALRLGELLWGLGYLTAEELDQALELQGRQESPLKIGDILVRRKFLGAEKLTEILAVQLGLPVLELSAREPDPALLDRCPTELCEQHRFVPCETRADGAVRVAFIDPLDPESVDAARGCLGADIEICIASASQLDDVLSRHKHYRDSGAGSPDVVKIAETLVLAALEQGASDIHVEPLPDMLRTRFRVDGVLVHHRDYPAEAGPLLNGHFRSLSGSDTAEAGLPCDGRISFRSENAQADLLLSFCDTVQGEQVVLRVLEGREELLPVDGLGMLPGMLDRFLEEVLAVPTGATLVAGPAGAGKSSTVYSCISHLNHPEVSIVTIEAPVEHRIRGVAQCPAASGPSFEAVLERAARQDPDILVVGEIRDRDVAAACFREALAGRTVLTTLQAEDSPGAVIRLLEMGIEPFLISAAASCIVSQRLLRRVCPHCAAAYQPDLVQLRRLGCSYGDLAGAGFRRGRGCPECRHSGYKGRLAVFELLIPEVFVREAVLQRRTPLELRRVALEQAGYVSMLEDGIVKAALGWTTLEEVLRTLPRAHKPRPLAELRSILGV